ncbi:MAG: PhoH family protein [bacterium]|nr:PhoH family protein [bacterium]
MTEIRLEFESPREVTALFGDREENLRIIETSLGVSVVPRANFIKVSGAGEAVGRCRALFEELAAATREGRAIRAHELKYAVRAVMQRGGDAVRSFLADRIRVSSKKLFVTPKTEGQKAYVDAIRRRDIVFGIGPAGTGKTYLAMAMAVEALIEERVSRIILTRPAVEAGESLGFLPGDLYEKITPYLRPLYDALYDMMEAGEVQRRLDRGIIEIAPLAYMRGRTLNDSFVILDEAQNSTGEQMKMFLTRLGFDSKAVITGDITQVDLPGHRPSGLVQVRTILDAVVGIEFVYFTERDVVRHELVQEIIRAYERANR